jgi:hypothetical protein
MKCPVCGLENTPAATMHCDCGYDFVRKTGGEKRDTILRDLVLGEMMQLAAQVTLGLLYYAFAVAEAGG